MLFSVESTALEIIVEVKILVYCHIKVNGRLLGKVSDKLFCSDGVGEDIDARDGRASCGCIQAGIVEWVVISSSRGSNPHLLHWQADSLSLSHMGSLKSFF